MEYFNVSFEKALGFCEEVFAGYGIPKEDCELISRALLEADLRGIESHGIQRLIRYHKEITKGMIDVKARPEVVRETPVSATVDAHSAIGQLTGSWSMNIAVKKALTTGVGMVTVRDSNHFGIGGYYADIAANSDLVGFCVTNTEAMIVPTGGTKAMLGTNPIAFSFPADPVPFMFDAATAVVTRGKLEVYKKNDKPLLPGWGIAADGSDSLSAAEVIECIANRKGGGIAPLGGTSVVHGGHKGYGLAAIVDVMSAILSGGLASDYVNTDLHKSGTCHFFMAMDYGVFGDKKAIKAHLSQFMTELRESGGAKGGRIYTPGEMEWYNRQKNLEAGIAINSATDAELRGIAQYHGLKYDLT